MKRQVTTNLVRLIGMNSGRLLRVMDLAIRIGLIRGEGQKRMDSGSVKQQMLMQRNVELERKHHKLER